MRKTSAIREPRKVEIQYRKALLVRVEWLKEHQAQIIKELKKNEGRYQGDAPADDLRATINKRKELYSARFTHKMSTNLAKTFYKRIDSYNSKKIGSALEALGIDLEYILKRENLKDFVGTAIQNQVDLITSIGSEHFDKIEKIVYNGMMEGEDFASLGKKIEEATGASAKRAKMIARDQTTTINTMLSKKRAEAAGITKGEWVKPKFVKTKNYTPRKSHIAANGKVFPLDKGLLVDGEYQFPGQAINCTCSFAFVVD
jgi:SPP1 gp7 family putative phage head morphogenesis protein